MFNNLETEMPKSRTIECMMKKNGPAWNFKGLLSFLIVLCARSAYFICWCKLVCRSMPCGFIYSPRADQCFLFDHRSEALPDHQGSAIIYWWNNNFRRSLPHHLSPCLSWGPLPWLTDELWAECETCLFLLLQTTRSFMGGDDWKSNTYSPSWESAQASPAETAW